MSLTFLNDGKLESFQQLEEGIFTHETTIKFPAKFSIQVNGKGPTDTKVDEQGNIVKDMYIKLTDINVDGMSCHQQYLYNSINLTTDLGEKIQKSYWGFNGQVGLDFDYQNSFFWALHCAEESPPK